MALLTRVGVLVLSLMSSPASAQVARWAAEIGEASRQSGLPRSWIERVMRAESGGRPLHRGRPVVSAAGAMGLMQLMPATWRELRSAHGLGPDPFHPADNILAGALYLRAMYDRFGYPGLFAAYNAGPGRYRHHLRTGAQLPRETRNYVARTAPEAELTGDDRSSAARRFSPPPVHPAPAPGDALFAVDRRSDQERP